MTGIDYSVIIRTIGTAGEKYQKLLESVKKLEPQPKEIIVVLPEGYDLPKEQLGYEKFYYSKKGMVYQRLKGISCCTTEYALICDDDVCFPSDFVHLLYDPLSDHEYGVSAAPLCSFFPQPGIKAFVSAITASAVPDWIHKDRYVYVLRSTGYSYNRHLRTGEHRYYEAQSVAGTCFFVNINAVKRLHWEDELWMDNNGYGAMEDQTMIYKAWLKGVKTVVVSDAEYEHMDARTSVRNNKPAVLYSLVFNRYVFWHRFIYLQEKNLKGRTAALIAWNYRCFWKNVYLIIDFLRKRISWKDVLLQKKALRDAEAFVYSQEYKKIPRI